MVSQKFDPDTDFLTLQKAFGLIVNLSDADNSNITPMAPNTLDGQLEGNIYIGFL